MAAVRSQGQNGVDCIGVQEHAWSAPGSWSAAPTRETVAGQADCAADPGKRVIDEAISRHVANEERLPLSLTQPEQETLNALLKKLIAGL